MKEYGCIYLGEIKRKVLENMKVRHGSPEFDNILEDQYSLALLVELNTMAKKGYRLVCKLSNRLIMEQMGPTTYMEGTLGRPFFKYPSREVRDEEGRFKL